MSTTNGPYNLTLLASRVIPNPTAQWGNPATAVQVQNSSGLVLQVTAAGKNYTLQPFVAQTLPLTPADGSPIEVLPTQNPSGSSTAGISATFVWLMAGESPPMQDGPLTAQAIAAALTGIVTTQGGVDILYDGGITTSGGTGIISGTTLRNYQTIVVALISGLPGSGSYQVTVSAGDTTIPSPFSGATLGSQTLNIANGVAGQAILPFANQSGDTWQVSVAGPSGRNYTCVVLGLTSSQVTEVLPNASNPLDVVQYGGAGRTQIGAFSGNTGILAAPTAGLAYRIHAVSAWGIAAANYVQFLDSASAVVAIVGTPGGTVPLDGQLLASGLSAVVIGGGGASGAMVATDLVSIPTIL